MIARLTMSLHCVQVYEANSLSCSVARLASERGRTKQISVGINCYQYPQMVTYISFPHIVSKAYHICPS